jgi:hypothetical protein
VRRHGIANDARILSLSLPAPNRYGESGKAATLAWPSFGKVVSQPPPNAL